MGFINHTRKQILEHDIVIGYLPKSRAQHLRDTTMTILEIEEQHGQFPHSNSFGQNSNEKSLYFLFKKVSLGHVLGPIFWSSLVPKAYQRLPTTLALPLNISLDISKGFSTPQPPKRTIPAQQRAARRCYCRYCHCMVTRFSTMRNKLTLV